MKAVYGLEVGQPRQMPSSSYVVYIGQLQRSAVIGNALRWFFVTRSDTQPNLSFTFVRHLRQQRALGQLLGFSTSVGSVQ
jgi:hypothetical protein